MGHGILHSAESVTIRDSHSPDDSRDATHQKAPGRRMVIIEKRNKAAPQCILLEPIKYESAQFSVSINRLNRALFAEEERTPLIPTKKPSERNVLIAWLARQECFQPSPYHCHASQHI